MAKKKNKAEESLVPKDEKTLKMEGVQNLYNFLFEACNILLGHVSQANFQDYIHLSSILSVYLMYMTRSLKPHSTKVVVMRSMHLCQNSIDLLFLMVAIGLMLETVPKI